VERFLCQRYAQLTVERPQRVAMADASIRAWLKKTLRAQWVSCSAALRLYRDSGYACEQSRFGAIYRALAPKVDQ
jgi:hypothetical protein